MVQFQVNGITANPVVSTLDDWMVFFYLKSRNNGITANPVVSTLEVKKYHSIIKAWLSLWLSQSIDLLLPELITVKSTLNNLLCIQMKIELHTWSNTLPEEWVSVHRFK